ncbi:MAG: T9SS type A sorting domain-containing protein [Bacteroidetes bacterium]|nr:T9SS type A sorting domain-containing protein [Bacteroidota bacterium]MCL6098954.1 T9SS type A sorting domain-containing protein [Bacteroidota bacterium]
MNKKIFILFFLLQFFVTKSFGQLWYITRGLSTNEEAWGIDVDSMGNVYWAVEEKNQGAYFNIFLFKIDSNARQVWQSAPWGGPYNDKAYKVTVKAPNVYLSGRTDSTGSPTSGDALVLSYTINNGSLNWQYSFDPTPDYGYEEIDGLIVQPDGISLSGWTHAQNTNDIDFLIQKISLTGQLVWSNTWDYNNLRRYDGANGHMAMDNNFLYIAGHVNKSSVIPPFSLLDGDGVLACFSRSNGMHQWHIIWGGASYDDALGMTMSSDSMLYVTGYTGSFGNSMQIYLNKYTRTGQLKWNRIWGGTGTEVSRALVTDGDSIIYVVGSTSSYGNGGNDIFILKYDSAGTLIDSLFWGGTYDEIAHDVAMYGDYLYITGETQSYGNGQINGDHIADGLLLKVNGRTMQAPGTTAVHEPVAFVPGEYSLTQNYPNPFNPTTTIRFSIPQREHVTLQVFDMLGRKVATLVDGDLGSGEHTVVFDAKGLASGVCFYRVHAGNFIETKKLILLR